MSTRNPALRWLLALLLVVAVPGQGASAASPVSAETLQAVAAVALHCDSAQGHHHHRHDLRPAQHLAQLAAATPALLPTPPVLALPVVPREVRPAPRAPPEAPSARQTPPPRGPPALA